MLGKGVVNDHAFSTTIKESLGTVCFLRSLSDQGDFERDRRGSNISNSFFRYRLRIYSI